MSVRLFIDTDGAPLEITVRSVGACTCGTASAVHDAGCSVLEPSHVDLVVDPARHRRPWWWRRHRRWPR